MQILFEEQPTGTTHFFRYASGYIVWCKVEDGQNNQPIIKEWDSGNEYWVPGIYPIEHYQKIGLTSIDDLPTHNDVGPDAAAPKGATHRYQHGGETSWYRETEDNLFVWRDGSWYASTQKSAKDLARVCPFGAVTILTQEVQLADNNESDLTWLARHVHQWYAGHDYVASRGAISVIWRPLAKGEIVGVIWFTRDQWLARRAELQNKPSFFDHPDAKCFVQNREGMWWKNTETDRVEPCGQLWQVGDRHEVKNITTLWIEVQKGSVLGDWRDTLERRPRDLSEPAVTARLTEATKNVLAAAPALMDEKFSFDRGDWFERGDLPPVGTVCEYTLGANAPWYKCEIKYVVRGDGVVMKRIPCGTEQYCSLYSKQPVSFRPIRIRTEREVLFDLLQKHNLLEDESCALVDAILAAGFKRDGGIA